MAYYGNDTNERLINVDTTVYAGDGDDYVQEDSRSLTAYGGQGNDTLFLNNDDRYLDGWGGYGNDAMFASSATASCYLYGDEGDDFIVGGASGDYIDGGQDRDNISGNGGPDQIYGGGGDDGGGYTFTAGTQIFGLGVAGLNGGEGDDYMDGGKGNDDLFGQEDDDTLLGGEGNDKLDGGSGTDRMSGGAGNDTFYVDSATDTVTEAVGDGTDTVYASVSYKLAAGQSIETLSTIDATATTAINLTGNEQSQSILGNAGDNIISAGDGADTIYGYGGHDDITGGTGADRFVFTRLADSTVSIAGRDYIRDFSHAQADKIDLRNIDADTSASGNQVFTFIGSSAFGHHAGELRAVDSGTAYTLIYGDVNGDATADFSIMVNRTAFVAGDFLL